MKYPDEQKSGSSANKNQLKWFLLCYSLIPPKSLYALYYDVLFMDIVAKTPCEIKFSVSFDTVKRDVYSIYDL